MNLMAWLRSFGRTENKELTEKIEELKATTKAYGGLLEPETSYRSFKCPGCNTLVQLSGFNVPQMAEEMARRGMRHVPDCVFGWKTGKETR